MPFQAIMVDALERLSGVTNRELFVKIWLQANTHTMARVITDIATMTAGYHQNVAPLEGLAPVGLVLYAKTRKGTVVLAVPADHVLWRSKVADIATWLQEPAQGQTKPSGYQLWILGDFSNKAQAGLKGLGWELHSDAQEDCSRKGNGIPDT